MYVLQGIAPLCSVLPRLLTDTGIINIRSKRGNNPSDYKDFKGRRYLIPQWLTLKIRWNKSYATVVIDMNNVNILPGNGSIFDELIVYFTTNNSTVGGSMGHAWSWVMIIS